MKIRNYAIAIAFLLIIFLVPVSSVIKNKIAPEENAEASETETYASGFEHLQGILNDFMDNLVLQDELIQYNTELTYKTSWGMYFESTQVLAGKNKWLFYKTETDGTPILDYMGVNYLSDDLTRLTAESLVETRDYLAAQGIDFIAMCVPNKEIIYSEYMPDTILKVNDKSRGEVFAEYMQENTDVKFLYPKETFLEAKESNTIYYRCDTHWNQIGAWLGIQEILNAEYGRKDDFNIEDFQLKEAVYDGDLERLAKVSSIYGLDDAYSFNIEAGDKSICGDKKVLFIGDSFSEFMNSIAQGYFAETNRVHCLSLEGDEIEKYQPDLVVFEVGERYLDLLYYRYQLK